MIRVGFIGVGGMGMAQAQAFKLVRGCSIAVGADVSAESRAKFLAAFPQAKAVTDYRQLLTDGSVDAVVISVPTGFHEKVATAALTARVPVLLEKPMARTVAECRQLIATSRKTKTLLMIAHCRRYDPHWSSWAKVVRAGKLGAPILWRHVAAGLGPGRWFMDERLGGGPLMDGAVHNYDFANWIFGDPVSVVSSAIKLNPKVSAVDTGSAVVRYRSGHQLLLSWSWAARGCSLHDIVGPKGFIQFGTAGVQVPESEKGKLNYCCLTNAKGKQTLIRSRPAQEMYANQARHFLDCIRGKAKCQTPGTEAVKAVAVAEAILRAGKTGSACAVKW